MNVMGWAANQAAQKKSNRLVSWALSEDGEVTLAVCGFVLFVVGVAAVVAI